MSHHDYFRKLREVARNALAVALNEIEKNDLEHYRFAALQLRICLEALTYERAFAYKEFMPLDQYEAWQPRKLLQELLAVDSKADQGGSLYIGEEEDYGVPPDKMSFLGSEKVISLSEIKEHYDALGSYLHAPSIKQINQGNLPKIERMAERCKDCVKTIERALSSTLRNVVMGFYIDFACEVCGEEIRRRAPFPPCEYKISCKCGYSYGIRSDSPGDYLVALNARDIECLNSNCTCVYKLRLEDFRYDHSWKCKECGMPHLLGMSVRQSD